MTLLYSIFLALILTEVLELLFARIWGLKKQQLTLVFLMNLLTNPVVNLLYFLLVSMLNCPKIPVIILLEAAVVMVESCCCHKVIAHPFRFSLCVNGFSYTLGALIQIL